MNMFETKVHGKWILAGEHSVLRGCPALVFPLKSQSMALKYKLTDERLKIKTFCSRNQDLTPLVNRVIQTVFNRFASQDKPVKGELEIHNNLVLGGGLGASACLCVLISRWVAALFADRQINVYDLAHNLENIFHGKSSGVDIASVQSGEPIYFKMGLPPKPFSIQWEPRWFLSYSDQVGDSAQCITQVSSLERDLQVRIDNQMQQAVTLARHALTRDEKEGFELLQESIGLASDCFKKWDIIPNSLQDHINFLISHGAVGVKPTGSGGGGFVLSLWRKPPPEKLKSILIPG